MNRNFQICLLICSFLIIGLAQDNQSNSTTSPENSSTNDEPQKKCRANRFNDTDTISNSYCLDLVKWPISDDTEKNYQALGQGALDLYTALYTKWKDRGSDEKNPSNDCLGVARIVFCAYQYPYCKEDVGDENAVCDFLCDIWKDRCPKEDDTYNIVCQKRRASECSHSSVLSVFIYSLNILLITLLMIA